VKKRIFIIAIAAMLISALIVPATTALAAKPAGNLASAQKVAWNLSAAVMPVPPYGSRDIPGSDTASKLIVNQPNGVTEVTITGAMNGLNPNTTYTVYLSKGYTPYVFTGWSVTGSWNFDLVSTKWPGTYSKTMTITQGSGGHFTGSGGNVPPGYTWSVDGYVTGNNVTFNLAYNAPMAGYVATFEGVINADGTMQGTWSDNWYSDSGPWHTTSGSAVKTHTGDIGWPGLFTGTVQPFTFVTDEYGAGSWHINLTDADLPAGPTGTIYNLSVWINEAGATMLISDTFPVTKG